MGGRGGSGHAHATAPAVERSASEASTTEHTTAQAPTPPAGTPAERRFDTLATTTVADLGGRGEWVNLRDLRATLDARGISRAAQDTQLKRMSREGKLRLVPRSNRKLLTPADHAASLRIGGEDAHWVQLP